MAPRESQKRASLKWDKENMTVLSCKIRKDQAVEFKAYCENQGSTSNTVLKDFVLGCIGEQKPETASRAPQGVTGRPAGDGVISLPSKTLEAAMRVSEATGETLPDFVRRAVDTQVERDELSRRLGISPVTGKKQEKEVV